jgi:spore germination cell wall hydrolase CwlJ-like protein
MKRILQNVPGEEVQLNIDIMEFDSATVQRIAQPDGRWTLIGIYPARGNAEPAAAPGAFAAAVAVIGGPGSRPPAGDDDKAIDLLARTLWGEARGEDMAGLEAVAAVIINRTKRGPGYWWGSTIEEVCQSPFQFSCWNKSDPNRVQLLAVTVADPAFAKCLEVARRAVNGQLADTTSGATHYHTSMVNPAWKTRPCAVIGNHLFYNDVA